MITMNNGKFNELLIFLLWNPSKMNILVFLQMNESTLLKRNNVLSIVLR